MNFNLLLPKVQNLITENAAALLTGTAVVGTITTAVLTGRASFKAAELIFEQEHERITEDDFEGSLNNTEKIKLVWPLFIPPAASAVTTVAATVFSYHISARKSAALVAAYGISEKAFSEYKEKVTERLGLKKETDIRDELAKDRIAKYPDNEQPIIVTGYGDVLCFDSYSGRYFQSTVDAIKKAENATNYEILHHLGASMSSFYDLIGLPATQYSDEMGWNSLNPLDISFSTQMSESGQPCIVIDFRSMPVLNYENSY